MPPPVPVPAQSSGRACWVSRTPKRRLRTRRCREKRSSGEKRAGCAEKVGLPDGDVFCGDSEEP